MKRFLLVTGILVLALYMTDFSLVQWIEKLKPPPGKIPETISRSRVSIGYRIDSAAGTRFDISMAKGRVRVLSNANFPSGFQSDTNKRWWYEIEYKIFNQRGDILDQRAYHHHTRITPHVTPDTGKPIKNKYYINDASIPGDSRITLFNMAEIPDAAFITCRLAWKDLAIQDVIVRFYSVEQVSERSIDKLWHRLSDDRKSNLAEGNVYPHDLLTEYEKINLLKNQWRPIGPMGVENRDYVVKRLYVLGDDMAQPSGTSILPAGLFIDEGRHGIVPLPQYGGLIRLEVICIDNGPLQQGGGLTINWYGKTKFARQSKKVVLDCGDTKIEDHWNGGLLELIPNRRVVVRAYEVDGESLKEITPDPLRVSTFRLADKDPVGFKIRHIRQMPTPFRADFRRILNQGEVEEEVPTTIRYEIIDHSGKTVAGEDAGFKVRGSTFDWITGNPSQTWISDPYSLFFELPFDTREIRFYSDDNVLINAYNRPPNLVKSTTVPDDYYKFNRNDKTQQPTWYALSPTDGEHLMRRNRRTLLGVQYRPPEEDPVSAHSKRADDLEWEAFEPKGNWRGRYIFVPWELQGRFKPNLFGIVYRPIKPNRKVPLDFMSSRTGAASVRPTLIYLKPTQKRLPITVTLDGNTIRQTSISGTRGELTLPPIRTGHHDITVKIQEPVSVFINFAGPGKRPHIKRFAIRLNQDGIVFPYRKPDHDDALLTARFFSPLGTPKKSRIRVTISAKRPKDLSPRNHWTLLDRRFIISANPTDPAPVLNTKNSYVDHGRLFFLPIGSDLQPGNYTVKLRSEAGTDGYIIFSRTHMKKNEKKRFFRERMMINDDLSG